MKTFCFLILAAPLFLFADRHWTQELPGGFLASVHIPKTRISIDEDLILHLTLKYPSTHKPDLDAVRMNLLKYVGVTEPPFALTEEKIEALDKGGIGITFRMEPQLAKIHFISLYDIPFIPLEEDSQDVKTIFSEIFEIDVFLPDIEPVWHGRPVGLLSLTDPLPIGLNADNRMRINHPGHINEESERSASIVSSRSIPWTRIVGVLLFCIIIFVARMQPRRAPDSEKTARKKAASARSKALSSLSALDLSEKEKFYVDLTNTVRRFIEEKYLIKATSQTTQEFLYAMANNPLFDNETQAMLSDFLIRSDRVKFAYHNPTRENCEEALQTAEQFIHRY